MINLLVALLRWFEKRFVFKISVTRRRRRRRRVVVVWENSNLVVARWDFPEQ